MILLNYQSYEQGIGNNALSIAKYAEDVCWQFNVPIFLSPNSVDISNVIKTVNIPVYTQHVDDFDPIDGYTGYLPVKVAVKIGAKGTLLNNSSHKMSWNQIVTTVARCKDNGLKVIIFADTLYVLKKVRDLFPDYIVFEPEELKSNKISLKNFKNGIIEEAINLLGNNLIIGSGIKSKIDVEIAKRMGIANICLSHQIILQRNIKKELISYVKAFI